MTTEPLKDATSNTEGVQSAAPATGSDATKDAPAAAAIQQQATEGADKAAGTEGAKAPAATDGKEGSTQAKDDGKGTKDGDKKDPPKDGESKEKPAGAPEKYELKPAEGVTITPEVQTQFEAIARELNLPQDKAQKLIDLAPHINKMYASQLVETATKISDQWTEETRSDKELGGGGDKAAYEATMALVAKTRDSFATPELLSLLQRFDATKNPNGTGLGNHPEVIRLFARIGKSISEDNKLVIGTGTPKTQAAAADRLYGQPKK